MRTLLLAFLFVVAAASHAAEHGFLKGNTHVHTNNSGDSDTPVAQVAKWYRERGFDFIVVTDHNVVTVHNDDAILVIPGVEMTKNVTLADGPGGDVEFYGLHMNGYFVPAAKKGYIDDPPAKERTRLSMYEAEFDAIKELGGVACLNHPNDRFSADAAMITRLAAKGLKFFEVYNCTPKSLNAGAPGKPSTEEIWDTVLSTGSLIYGIVSDDAHHYYDAEEARKVGYEPRIGNMAWVMVRAKEKTADSIKEAMLRGDFYGSTGVTLKKLETAGGVMTIEVAPVEGRKYGIKFIGRGGKVLAESAETSARYAFVGNEMYVRAIVTDSTGKKAWVQPVMPKRD